MRLNTVIQGDCLEVMRGMPSRSINCVITSPPYWRLRDYGFDGQWGLEPTFEQYLNNLIALMRECMRVLAEDGTMWINLGDTYYGNKKPGGGDPTLGVRNLRVVGEYPRKPIIDYPTKSLCLLPHRFAIRCIDELGLILRNDIIWAKPNGMPESVTDRFSKKHEYFFFFVKSQKYYFDLGSIRENFAKSSIERLSQNIEMQAGSGRVTGKTNGNMKAAGNITKIPMDAAEMFGSPRARAYRKYDGTGYGSDGKGVRNHSGNSMNHPLGKNPGDVSDFWKISTKPSKEKHCATYNSELIDKPIIAGCPEGGTILDPFAGTGTTLARAVQLGRNAIGIEGNPEYCEIAQKHIENELAQFKLELN